MGPLPAPMPRESSRSGESGDASPSPSSAATLLMPRAWCCSFVGALDQPRPLSASILVAEILIDDVLLRMSECPSSTGLAISLLQRPLVARVAPPPSRFSTSTPCMSQALPLWLYLSPIPRRRRPSGTRELAAPDRLDSGAGRSRSLPPSHA
jgi:hypothetical protein